MIIFLCIAALVIFFLVWSTVEAQRYGINRIKISTDKIKSDFKIVFIADIHYGDYYNKNRMESIVNDINKLNADIIILGGDYINIAKKAEVKEGVIEGFFYHISKLKAKYGVAAVLGNHEYYLKDRIKLIYDNFQRSGFKLLINESQHFKVKDNEIVIHGVDDILEGKMDVSKLNFDNKCMNIVISHNPDFFETFNNDYEVGLSGHTHGGQVNFFRLYAPITESKYGQKYTRTLNMLGNSYVITTRGLGCSALPIRFCSLPEIIEIDVTKKSEI